MEKNRRVKILSIIALVLAIVGMSLGFAAFSATLNISSSASVSPSSDSFKVVLSDSAISVDDVGSVSFISGEATNGAFASDALIDETVAYDLGASFTKTNQTVTYTFYIHNIGEYDAYLTGITFVALDNGSYKKCSSSTTDSTKATESLVQSACSGIKITISIGGTTYDVGSTNIFGHMLPKGGVEEFKFNIEYVDGATLADGPFSVEISDFKLNYSTVDNKLISFKIADVVYYAESGMTWAQWIESEYNTGDFGNYCDSLYNDNNGKQVLEGSKTVMLKDTIIHNYEYSYNSGVRICSQKIFF